MSHNSTERTIEPTIGDQADALDVLVALTERFPGLPAPYITLNTVYRPARIELQLRTPAEFEAWRDALGADAEQVALHPHCQGSWLAVEVQHLGFQVRLTGHGVGAASVSLLKAVAA
ncbi:hypothetical protein AB0M28_13690 [Streptomyces sp. NPDC051940]|uniref:hypothetical protein n=1 Tax=Streptomyces sp. NPDC051940 TaxID=3155675 RepID=UPI00344902D0